MQISYNGIKMLKELEGFRAEAYLDTGGVWTVGYGTTNWNGKPVEAGMTMTEQEAELALQADLARAQTTVNQEVRVPLKQNQFDALVCFVYNIGSSAFRRSSMLMLLNSAMYDEAANQFMRWRYDNGKEIPGLIVRREKERTMFA
jgi:lysozyme